MRSEPPPHQATPQGQHRPAIICASADNKGTRSVTLPSPLPCIAGEESLTRKDISLSLYICCPTVNNMKVRVRVPDERTAYTNDDALTPNIVVSSFRGEPSFAHEIQAASATLVCEGFASTDFGVERFEYYKSAPSHAILVSEDPEQRVYKCELRFPPESRKYPSTLQFDGIRDRIQWSVRADVTAVNGRLSAKHPTTFVQSGDLPNLLNLIDTEHSETIEDTIVDVVTTHSTAGLPQYPLSAGIGLSIECSQPNIFEIKRLRLLLADLTKVTVRQQHKILPVHRWLLSDTAFDPAVVLGTVTKFDEHTNDVQIDHATLPETFECAEFAHSFDLVVEVTLLSRSTGRVRKVTSLAPVTVLPRIAHIYDAEELNRSTTNGSDIAYITDSSDEDFDSDNEALRERDIRFDLVPRVHTVASSESLRSVFSDHHKLGFETPTPEVAQVSFH